MTVVVNNGVIAATNVGYNINYRQIACWMKNQMILKKKLEDAQFMSNFVMNM